jgi:hypothetical protein
MKTLNLPDQATANKIMNRANEIVKEKKVSLATAVGIAQNEDGMATGHDTGQAKAEANADPTAWIHRRAGEMHAENPTLSLATCIGMATFEFNNQKQNLGR